MLCEIISRDSLRIFNSYFVQYCLFMFYMNERFVVFIASVLMNFEFRLLTRLAYFIKNFPCRVKKIPQAFFPLKTLAMKVIESKAGFLAIVCVMISKQKHLVTKKFHSPKLQSKHNTLLTCLAGADLLVGAASPPEPSYIMGQIYCIKRLSLSEYRRYFN